MTILETLQRVCEQASHVDALTGNLAVLRESLPDLGELADEREPEDIERIAQQARIAHQFVTDLRAGLAEAMKLLAADATPHSSELSP